MFQYSYIVRTGSIPSYSMVVESNKDVVASMLSAWSYCLDVFVSPIGNFGHILYLDDAKSDNYYFKVPVRVSIVDDGESVIAEFPEAQIAVSDDNAADAIQWLTETIIDSFITFGNQRDRLGPIPAQQLRVLEKYVGKMQAP
jgi:hypothetical protein